MNDKIIREFISFGGACPFGCLHCYTFHDQFKTSPDLSIEGLVQSVSNKKFNTIYISGYNENFSNPDNGLDLTEQIFNKYKCDILFTTRNTFNSKQISRLVKLNNRMKSFGKMLYACVSIPAYNSYKKIENNPKIPSPKERISFINDMGSKGLCTFLTLRPLFPDQFIPTDEVAKIIEQCSPLATAVISSGIVLDNNIINKLSGFPKEIKVSDAPLMTCLNQSYEVQYVDVENELNSLRDTCNKLNVPFFTDSIPAVQYAKKNFRSK